MKEDLILILDKLAKTYPEDKRTPLQRSIEDPLWKNDSNGKKCLEFFKHNKEYAIFDNHIQRLGRGGTAISFEELVEWTLNRTRKVGGKNTINELDNYITSTKINVEYITLIAGLTTECHFTFCNKAKLCVPHFIENKELANDLVSGIFLRTPFPKIRTILTLPYSQEVIHESTIIHQKQNWDSFEKPYEKAEDVLLCLSLALNTRYGVHPVASMFVAPNNLPFIHPVSGWSIIPFKQPALSPEVLEIDLKRADKILNSFTQLDYNFKNKLKISLKKLNTFGSGENQVDKAIDLRICLESIFFDKQVKGIKKKLSTRASNFLGSNPEEKVEISTLMTEAYKITSNAIHKGFLTVDDDTRILKTVAELAKQAIIKLIQDGEVNWKDYEFKTN